MGTQGKARRKAEGPAFVTWVGGDFGWFAWVALGVVGLCFGSFLNVVIHRLPLGESIVGPRSRCPHCRRRIAPWDNIPILSYLFLRGRCRHCRTKIGIRYPIVEAVGAACVLVGFVTSEDLAEALVKSLFLLAMVVVTLIDLDYRIIPNEISLPGVVLGILACPWIGVLRQDGLIGAASGAGSLLALAYGYRRLRGIEGMGMGDVKLAGLIGAFLGWKGILLTVLVGSLAGALVGVALILARRAGGRTALPFGTFLAPAAALVLLAGPWIWNWYATLLPGR